MDPEKARFAQPTAARTLDEIIGGADVFLGLSAGGVLTQAMVGEDGAAAVDPRARQSRLRKSCRRRSGRCATMPSSPPAAATIPIRSTTCCVFPSYFAAHWTSARPPSRAPWKSPPCTPSRNSRARNKATSSPPPMAASRIWPSGPEYLIPKPFDPRLIVKIAPAVAKAAMESGVATRPIADLEAYGQRLLQFVYHSGTLMQPIFAAARSVPAERSRIVYAEGEDERVLRAVQIAVDEKLATPILVGRPAVIERGIKRHGLRIRIGEHLTVVNPEHDDAISRVLAGVSQAHRTQRRHRAIRQAGNAPPHDADRRDAAEEGRGGRLDLRHHQHHRAASALHRSGHRPPRRASTCTAR